ncbi:hypothetical protein ACRQU7_17775 [Caproiciproducens sp. R1]|jgi:hydroxylamine reductase|uniref:hypothetical protein n=1 Tax=Caproiciproducens sp. R1 TaxID=3435000 RepID=UPI004034859C
MYKEENPQIAKGQLIGALIGLARATDGNVNRPTEETDRAFLKGMQMCFPHWEESCQQIHDQIEVIHEEKWKLVSRCLECASPCGRNNDCDIAGLNGMKNAQLRYVLLSGLLFMASSSISDVKLLKDHKIMGFFYRAFFFIGYDCDEKDLILFINELGEWQYKLSFQMDSDE